MATRNYMPAYNALHGDTRLTAQCEAYILTAACPAIFAESTSTTNHAARLAWATSMETDAAALAKAARRLAIKCVQNTTILAAITASTPAEDSDVEFVGATYLPTLVSLGA